MQPPPGFGMPAGSGSVAQTSQKCLTSLRRFAFSHFTSSQPAFFRSILASRKVLGPRVRWHPSHSTQTAAV